MKISKVAATTARRFFGLCQVNGRLDDERLRTVVTRLIESQPRDYRAILAAIQRLARLEAKSREVVVESATALDFNAQKRVADGLARDYGDKLNFQFQVNPSLLGGMKIRVGDDVLDGSVQGRIDRLSKAFQ